MFEIIDPLTTVNYDDTLLSTPGASFFHTSAWARVLAESFGYAPHYFAKKTGERFSVLVPFMEINSFLTGKRGISLPFSDHCDPIMPNDNSLFAFFNHAIGYGNRRGWKYLELRPSNALPEGIQASQVFLSHTIDLSINSKEILSGFRSNTRSDIKKAIRSDVTVAFGGNAEFMEQYYRLHSLTRKHHGIPPQPLSFFRKLLEHVVSSGNGQIGLAYHGQHIIAGAVFCSFGKQALYKYAASDKNFQNAKPNNLILWEAVQKYSSMGYDSLCLGRTDTENKGLIHFKRGWAGRESTSEYCKYDLKQSIYMKQNSKLHGFHNKLFSNMPLPLLRLAGDLLYKHIG